MLRTIELDEAAEFHRVLAVAFGHPYRSDRDDADVSVLEPDRSFAVVEDGRMVAITTAMSRRLTVPGGEVGAAAVRAVAVLPTHRRRGLLRSLMRAQLDEVHERGEPLAGLWATQHPIYARFGYGHATPVQHLELPAAGATFAPTAPAPVPVRLVDPDDTIKVVSAIHDEARLDRPGVLDRTDAWWRRRYADPSAPVVCVVAEGEGGRGYALYAVSPTWGERGPDNHLDVRELVATTPAVTASLWRYLLDIDLVGHVSASIRPVDDPLPDLLDDPRLARRTTGEGLWVRVVDVAVALAARRYATPIDVVVHIDDPFCPWNDGRWQLIGGPDGAACARIEADADIRLPASELSGLYLGGVSARQRASAGRIEERRTGAVAALDAALSWSPAPWPVTWF